MLNDYLVEDDGSPSADLAHVAFLCAMECLSRCRVLQSNESVLPGQRNTLRNQQRDVVLRIAFDSSQTDKANFLVMTMRHPVTRARTRRSEAPSVENSAPEPIGESQDSGNDVNRGFCTFAAQLPSRFQWLTSRR